MSALDQKLKDQIARWGEDAKGCRALERQTGRNREWIEAERFRVAAETMETVCNEARKLFE